jgi:hypothetical protein
MEATRLGYPPVGGSRADPDHQIRSLGAALAVLHVGPRFLRNRRLKVSRRPSHITPIPGFVAAAVKYHATW